MFQSQRIRQTIAHSFLVIFTLMLLNGIVFRHAHRLSNGTIITHAHPYKASNQKTPFQPNDHTTKELFLLDNFSNALFVGLTLATAVVGVKIRQIAIPRPVSSYLLAFYPASFFGKSSLRGPPTTVDFLC